MKFSIVRNDKSSAVRLSTKTVERFMERIQKDTKAGDIAKLREHVLCFGDAKNYYKLSSMAMVYPTAIYDHLRSIAGSGLKANGVATFGRYLRNIPNILSRRVGPSRQYLVREKPRK